jgi:dsRNA-specific ribonuclease
MNKDNYIKSMEQINISEDFKERTAKLMKETRNQNSRKNTSIKKMALTAASAAIIIAAGAAAVNMTNSSPINKNTTINKTVATDNTTANTTEAVAQGGITVPEIQILRPRRRPEAHA